jgi:hypothetical protein
MIITALFSMSYGLVYPVLQFMAVSVARAWGEPTYTAFSVTHHHQATCNAII